MIGRMEVSPPSHTAAYVNTKISHLHVCMLCDIMRMSSMLIFHLYNQVHVGLLLHTHNPLSMH